MKQILTREEVAKAIQELVEKGKKPTLAAIHASLNGCGSMSTLVRLKAEIDAATKSGTDSPEAIKAFREIWSMAVDEGRKHQEVVLQELRESIQALAKENERLEGASIAALNHVAELEQAKSRIEAELRQVREKADGELTQSRSMLANATAQSAIALQKLSEAQASHAAEVKSLQSDLTSAVRKAHDIELQLVRATALLEVKKIDPATAELRKPKNFSEKRG